MNTQDVLVIRCPGCGGKDIRRSYSHGVFDAVMRSLHRIPFRCRVCQRRFYRAEEVPAQAGGASGA